MKTFILSAAFAFLSVFSLHGQNVSYKTITDDPYDIKGLCISLDPFYADAWGTNPNIGFGVRADMYFKKLLSFNIDFRRAYLDINAKEHEDASLPKPLEALKKHNYIELGAQLTFLDRSKDKDIRVVLSSSSSGRYTTTNYIRVPGTLRKVKQLRGGLVSTRTAIDIGDAGEADNTFKATLVGDTTSFKFGSFSNTTDGSATYGGYTMMNLFMIYGGISAKRITNLFIDSDYGRKSNNSVYDFYADVLYAPVVKFENVYTVGGKEWELSCSEVKNIGWRLGFSARRSASSFLSYKFEFGSRPGFVGGEGILQTNYYLLVAMGWSIPFKIGAINAKG